MSHGVVPHLATVTATATVAYNAVDLQLDVTRPHQHTSPLPDHNVPYQPLNHYNMTSDPTTQSTFYSSAESFQVSDFNVSSAPTSSVHRTATCSPSDSHYNAGHATWYGENQYLPSDFLNSTTDGFVGYKQYDNDFINGLDDVVEYPGSHFLQDDYSRHTGCSTTSNFDHSSQSSAYSGWPQLEDYLHDERAGGCRYRERSNEHEKYTGEMEHSGYDPEFYTNCHAAREGSESSRTDSQCFFTLPCSQSPDLSSCRTKEDCVTQNMLHAVNPFQENAAHGPNWFETDIDNPRNETHQSPAVRTARNLENETVFHEINTRTQNNKFKDCSQQVCSKNQKQSNDNVRQKHDYMKSKQNEHIQLCSETSSDARCQPASSDKVHPDDSESSMNISQSVHQQPLPFSPTRSPNCHAKPSGSVSSCAAGLPSSISTPQITGSSSQINNQTTPPVNSSQCTTAQSSVKATESFCRTGSPVNQTDSSLSSPPSSVQPLIDVDHLLSSGVTVAGFKPRPIIRKRRKVMIPTTQKDVSYWHKRKKNNDSAKRSREAKKEKEKNFYRRALELEYENYFLKERLGQMEAQLQAVTGVASGLTPPLDYPGMVPMASVDYSSASQCIS